MDETLRLTPTESVTIVESNAELVEVEAVYGPHGDPPPKHLHPSQDEHFRVLEGTLRVRVDGAERDLASGDVIEIGRGVVHQMWNPGTDPARVSWQTRPGGRTESWFRELGALQASGRTGRNGTPQLPAIAVLLTEYRDVFRLAGPDPLIRPALSALAVVGRVRGDRPEFA
jgi:quercetin dioxygenase-like cupin family protein